jgi:hypothetical protein
MDMSVENAKGHICPMSISRQARARSCDADDCMAWRWRYEYVEKKGIDHKVWQPSSKGYCGMVAAEVSIDCGEG